MAYTLKLSPQPHSLFTFGLRNTQTAFRPLDAKSISVPWRKGSLFECTTTLTP